LKYDTTLKAMFGERAPVRLLETILGKGVAVRILRRISERNGAERRDALVNF
jgi:hypothetical protein